MRPDDNRHHTWAGYVAGCREDCCRTAARNYQKRRVYEGAPRRVSGIGVRRRIQALACLGWDMYAIAREVGTENRETVRQWALHHTVYRSTHERMAQVYEQLSMQLPPERTPAERANATKTRNRADRKGWAPPLAWDDIDDPTERPKLGRNRRRAKSEIDEVIVGRLLNLERIPCTTAEKHEAMRRWKAAGKPARQLALAQGWHDNRYDTQRVVASRQADAPELEEESA